MTTNKYKQVYRESANGVRTAYRNKWVIMCLSLVCVIVVLEWGASIATLIPKTNAHNIVEYTQEPTAKQIASDEVNDYVNKVADEIFIELLPTYKEQARQQAIQAVGNELVRLTEVSPHVDYIYMREVVDMIQ